MCYMCLQDDTFSVKKQTTEQRLRERAAYVKKLLTEANEHLICDEGDDVIKRLKEEQYELARQL